MMGKASRERRRQQINDRRHISHLDRPHWAGAQGFEYAWKLTETYIQLGDMINKSFNSDDPKERADARMAHLERDLDILNRKKAIFDMILRSLGETTPMKQSVGIPGIYPADQDGKYQITEEHRDYGQGLYITSLEHQVALRDASPLLFDPLSMPEYDERAAENLQLPFPVVTCDFLAESGMCMPVVTMTDHPHFHPTIDVNIDVKVDGSIKKHDAGSINTEWVGLIAATMRQEGDAIDIWPVITTLKPNVEDDSQSVGAILYGRARLNGELPEPPPGMEKIQIGPASVWRVDSDDDEKETGFAELWIVRPALAACAALSLLEAVNVEIQEAQLSRAERRRAMRTGAEPALEVVVRHKHSKREEHETGDGMPIDWQHRWTVRGHWKHFTHGPFFKANPRKRVIDPIHGECIKVWCPPFIKGPADKPLVLKSRRVIE